MHTNEVAFMKYTDLVSTGMIAVPLSFPLIFSQWLCGGPTWVFYVSPGVSPFMSFILGLLVIIYYPKFNGVSTEFIIVTAASVL